MRVAKSSAPSKMGTFLWWVLEFWAFGCPPARGAPTEITAGETPTSACGDMGDYSVIYLYVRNDKVGDTHPIFREYRRRRDALTACKKSSGPHKGYGGAVRFRKGGSRHFAPAWVIVENEYITR